MKLLRSPEGAGPVARDLLRITGCEVSLIVILAIGLLWFGRRRLRAVSRARSSGQELSLVMRIEPWAYIITVALLALMILAILGFVPCGYPVFSDSGCSDATLTLLLISGEATIVGAVVAGWVAVACTWLRSRYERRADR